MPGSSAKQTCGVLAVGQAAIDLVRQDDDVGVAQDRGDGLQFVPRHDRAGRIVRIGQDEQLGARGDGRAQRIRGELELVLHAGGQRDGHAARHLGQRGIADKAGLGDEHFLARVDQRADGVVDCLRAADRDQDLLFRIIAELIFAARQRGDLAAQLGQTPVGGIEGLAFFQRLDARAADLPWGFKVGLADAERDRLGHGGNHIEELADARGFDLLDAVGEQLFIIYHAIVTSLLSWSEGSNSTP